MLEQIGDVKNIKTFIKKAKDKNDPFRLMGFGHRIYKNYDPRANLLKEIALEILENIKDEKQSKCFEIAKEIEKIALNDEYFIKKNYIQM